jgi:hypothetical protein
MLFYGAQLAVLFAYEATLVLSQGRPWKATLAFFSGDPYNIVVATLIL